MIVVVTLDRKGAESTTDRDRLSALVWLAWFGLAGGVNLLGGLLQQTGHHLVGRLEDGCAHQLFQFQHRRAAGCLCGKPGHQLLDFGFLGQEDLGEGLGLRPGFFFMPMTSSARVL